MAISEALEAVASLSPAQNTMFRTLCRLGQEASISTIATEAELHPNSARETLDVLVKKGLVTRRRKSSRGRGRPAWVYEINAPESTITFHRQFSDFITVVASTLLDEKENREEAAEQLGREWGRIHMAGSITPDHSQNPKMEREEQISRHISKIRVFLTSLGFQVRCNCEHSSYSEPEHAIRIYAFPIWPEETNIREIVSWIYRGLVSEVIEALSQYMLRLEFIPALPEQQFLYTIELHFQNPDYSGQSAHPADGHPSPQPNQRENH